MHRFKQRTFKNVIGLELSGKTSTTEYSQIVPVLEAKIKEYGKIRLFIELDHWKGWEPYAAFKDILFVLKNPLSIERVAFVLGSAEDKQTILVDQPLTPWFNAKTLYFSIKEKESGWQWVCEGVVPATPAAELQQAT